MFTRLFVPLVLVLSSSPAVAAEYLFDANGESYTISFGGFGGDPVMDIEGLNAELDLMLVSGIGTNALTFNYTLTNTSTVGGSDWPAPSGWSTG